MKKLILTNAIILSSVLFYGCSDQQDTAQTNKNTTTAAEQTTTAQTAAPANPVQTNAVPAPAADKNFVHPPMPKTTVAAAAQTSLNSGVVEEVVHSGGYTYVNAKVGDKNIWLAGSQNPVKVGQTIYWGDYAVMPNFRSKSLDRTFKEILFVSAFSTTKPTAKAPAAASASVNSGKVISAQNAAGYTYIEVNTSGNTVWLAAPEIAVQTNDQIVWNGASKMSNFTSKSLDKTFAEILFVASVKVSN